MMPLLQTFTNKITYFCLILVNKKNDRKTMKGYNDSITVKGNKLTARRRRKVREISSPASILT